VLLVTLPEATPVHEASRLQDDLARAGISPYAWVVNQSLAAAGVSAPVLAARAQLEPQYIAEVEAKGAAQMVIIPWRAEQPIGAEALHRFAHASA
jgi:arsenite-transporting ATPase